MVLGVWMFSTEYEIVRREYHDHQDYRITPASLAILTDEASRLLISSLKFSLGVRNRGKVFIILYRGEALKISTKILLSNSESVVVRNSTSL